MLTRGAIVIEFYLRMLRRRDLSMLWASQVLSAIGDQLHSIAVLWISMQIAGAKGGLVVAAGTLAGLSLGLFSGVYADRWNRRLAMVIVDVLRAVAVLILALVAQSGHLELWHMAVIAVVVQGLGSLFGPCMQASLPALTDDADVLRAMTSLMIMTLRIARLVGPALGGAILSCCPIHVFFLFDSSTYVVSALAIWALGSRYCWKAERITNDHGASGVINDLRASAALVLSNRQLTITFIMGFFCAFLWAVAYVVGIPMMLKQTSIGGGLGVMAYAYIISSYGAGNVLSNIVVGPRRLHHRPAFFNSIGIAVMGCGFLFLSTAASLPLACLGAAMAAVGGPIGDLSTTGLIQTQPNEHRGKLNSFCDFLAGMGFASGLSLAPAIIDRTGGAHGIFLAALCMIAVGLPCIVADLASRHRNRLPAANLIDP